MKFNKYIKGKRVISATEKMFNLIYEKEGYKEYNEPTEQPINEVKEDTNVIVYQDMTKAEIGNILAKKGIEHNSRDNKDKLIELLLGSE